MKTFVISCVVASSIVLPIRGVQAVSSGHHMPLVEVVSTTNDSGRGSLRAAITRANRNAKTRIEFALATTDKGFDASKRAWTIAVRTPLPALSKPDTIIEGNGSVTVSGANSPQNGTGLSIESVRCSIKGVKWANWATAAIAVHSSRATVEGNEFQNSATGIRVEGVKAQSNRFERNLFSGVPTPIALLDGSNGGIAPPTLSIVRQDAAQQMSHRFTVRFQGKPNTKVSVELGYSPNEMRSVPQVNAVQELAAIKTDARGVAVWEFNRTRYPAGSWTALATQDGNTSSLSGTVVMPYLR